LAKAVSSFNASLSTVRFPFAAYEEHVIWFLKNNDLVNCRKRFLS
jgi:hypothetical protein